MFSAATLNLKDNEAGMHTFTSFPDSAVDEGDEEDDRNQLIEKKTKPGWSFAYYQEFFDIDTSTVLGRVKGSMIPLPKYNFNSNYIKGKPDIYGPFWICATVVVCFGVCGNLATFIHNLSNPGYTYTSQFHLLPIAALIIYSYGFFFPLLVKVILWWRKAAKDLAMSHIICIYGYSLFIFIPASILFIIPNEVFVWIVLSIAICLSGCVIVMSMWSAFADDSKKFSVLLMFFLFGAHVTIMIILRFYFFPVFDPITLTHPNSTVLLPTPLSTEGVTLATN